LVNIQGTFNGDTTYPNLFCFVIAPPASGKGVLKYAKAMGLKRQTILHESIPSIDIFIPANISTATIYQHLHTNGGVGILFESEADTMKYTFKQEWGGYDDLLRKAFHFEEATLERKDRSIKIEHPRLSVILSGTPNQIQGIIPDVDNGLFSRFIFYICKSESEWDREIDMAGFSLDGYFGDLSIFFAIIISNSMWAVQFSFTNRQKEIFHSRFEKWHNEFLVCYNDENIGIIKRLGNITFRIAMILTAIRFGYQSNPPATPIVYCNDIDFETAFLLAETYKQHALFIYVTMKDKPTNNKPIDKFVLQFYEMLPPDSDFTKSDAIEIGKLINIAERTVGKYLKNLVKAAYIEQPRYGLYRKTKIEGVEYEVLNPHELGE